MYRDIMQYNEVINGTYMILGPIGDGGTGVIYLAEHLHLQKKVVLKKIKSRYSSGSTVRQEADILKSLHHMYLPQVYDFIERDGDIFTVIDYIDGSDLARYISTSTPVDEGRLVKWMCQMCDALTYLHSRNPIILHNDIKPANIIINENDDICLIDFNISSDDSEAVLGFTPAYASPEQYLKVLCITNYDYVCGDGACLFGGLSALLDPRSDLYSLGAAFYAMALRVQPDVDRAVRGEQPPLNPQTCGLSEGFCRIINKLMSVRPENRYQSADELKKALQKLKRQDAAYKKFLLMQVGSMLLSGALAVGGICSIVHGVNTERTDDYSARFNAVETAYNSGDYERVLKDGLELIGDDPKGKVIGSSWRAKIYHLVAMSYYNQGTYDKAAENITRAAENENIADNLKAYEMDAAVIMAYSGNYQTAQSYLDSALSHGINETQYYLTVMQIDFAKGDYNGVYENFQRLDASEIKTLDEDTREHLYMALGDSFNKADNHTEAKRFYNEAYNVRQSLSVARKLGDMEFEDGKVSQEPEVYINAAIYWYSNVMQSELRTVEDIVNYSKMHRAMADAANNTEWYGICENILLEQVNYFPNDYRIYQQLAITEYYMNKTSEARANCNKAFELFNALPADRQAAEYGDEMRFLESVRDQIR